jgi:CRISPR-associated endonuclease/helicase Cas3
VSALKSSDFSRFFWEIHGKDPFPWQVRLLEQLVASSNAGKDPWPSILDLPTGSGKTAAIDIALFHLALEAQAEQARHAPVRIAFVVDRRLIVDDAYERARKIQKHLLESGDPASVSFRVSQSLQRLGEIGKPLIVKRLRGGVPRERDWARTPSQPTILCSTVDQVGSRLLFRGYGVTDRMKSIHAGLLGSDCLILLDEAHISEPFRQTLDRVKSYRGKHWRESEYVSPWCVSQLSATARKDDDIDDSSRCAEANFALDNVDFEHPLLKARVGAPKVAQLRLSAGGKSKKVEDSEDSKEDADKVSQAFRKVLLEEVESALTALRDGGVRYPAVGVIVNRVLSARSLYDEVRGREDRDAILLIGPARPVDREELVKQLFYIRTGEARTLEKPLILIATQCVEVGVDIDLDGLVTELAPLDSLRQRFGRLNRNGRDISPYAVIVASKPDLLPRAKDPVYGEAPRKAWEYLQEIAAKKKNSAEVDFGIIAFDAILRKTPPPKEAFSSKTDAPILLPGHLDLLTQTAPVPRVDPEVSLYLRGADVQPDSVSVIWRGDLESAGKRLKPEQAQRLLELLPPRSTEAIELSVWAVRKWLGQNKAALNKFSDVAMPDPDEDASPRTNGKPVFRWKGLGKGSDWVLESNIRPGDTLVVPSSYGGLDDSGWKPILKDRTLDPEERVSDKAEKAAEPYAGRRFVVRVMTELIGQSATAARLSDILEENLSLGWKPLQQALLQLDLPEEMKSRLRDLDRAKKDKVELYSDLYDFPDSEGAMRVGGVVFVARLGLKGEPQNSEDGLSSTENDVNGSLPGYQQSLEEHSREVEAKAGEFAKQVGLPQPLVEDIVLAAFLHDAGKADLRFQAWLNYGNPLVTAMRPPKMVLAKSGRVLPKNAREKSGLPEGWRHEAFSVRLAMTHARFLQAHDPDLVLWLIGTHHGLGRPFFPHEDPLDSKDRMIPAILDLDQSVPAGVGPQALGFDWKGLDWVGLFERLKWRYGVWELARLEAIVRLADHRASEEAAIREGAE